MSAGDVIGGDLGAGVYYLRVGGGLGWTKLRPIPPLREGHQATRGEPCVLCAQGFVAGDETTLVPIGPCRIDDDDIRNFMLGRGYIAEAMLVHARCVPPYVRSVKELLELAGVDEHGH